MSDQNPSSSVRTRIRRFSEIDNAYGEHHQFRSRVPFKSFDDRIQESRLIFSGTVSPIGGYSRRHPNHEATTVYRSLCLRGFVVQGSLDPRNRGVVREFISNIPFYEDGALIRGYVYRFSPSVINQLMMTPSVEHSFQWKDVALNQAITHLTGGQCAGWMGFSLNALLDPFKILYRVCERSWLPGQDSDLMMRKRLRLVYAVTKPVSASKEVPLLPGDEDPIGKGIPIYDSGSDGSGPRGRRRLC
ncbi:hypothetical protein DY000_02024756 [Brassica cretica]|uniref:Uncharacterized protein n=1 Tax=Brassica cretica TaxID=69181 RepID=A0ABQ7E319_BRACR|nr:hypothetical protein DY000_02024756 [Brassica cretica]